MTFTRLYRLAIFALLSVFFAVQSVSVAHAAQHGDDIHEHNGQVCVLAAITAHSVVAVTPAPTVSVIPQTTTPTLYSAVFVDAPRESKQARAPPPRGPPT